MGLGFGVLLSLSRKTLTRRTLKHNFLLRTLKQNSHAELSSNIYMYGGGVEVLRAGHDKARDREREKDRERERECVCVWVSARACGLCVGVRGVCAGSGPRAIRGGHRGRP